MMVYFHFLSLFFLKHLHILKHTVTCLEVFCVFFFFCFDLDLLFCTSVPFSDYVRQKYNLLCSFALVTASTPHGFLRDELYVLQVWPRPESNWELCLTRGSVQPLLLQKVGACSVTVVFLLSLLFLINMLAAEVLVDGQSFASVIYKHWATR